MAILDQSWKAANSALKEKIMAGAEGIEPSHGGIKIWQTVSGINSHLDSFCPVPLLEYHRFPRLSKRSRFVGKRDAKQLARATAGHAASIGMSGALSFAFADLLASLGGWSRWLFSR